MTLDFSTIVHVLSSHGQAQGQGQGPIGHTQLKSYLRHDHPILGVDRVIDHDFAKGWIHAVRAISSSQPVFQGHFKDAAIYPGTTLCQDLIQLGIVLLIGMTGPLKKETETTVVSNINASFGHPIPPGSILDVAFWKTAASSKAIEFQFEAKVRDFAFYQTPNKFGIKFEAPISGTCRIARLSRKIYEGIGL